MPFSSRTVGIYTLGCKVNQYESEAIAEAFCKEGFSVQAPELPCDVYVINTCTVTAESDRKARQFIRRAIHQNPDAKILVTGCLSQTQPEAVARIPGVDYICGNASKLSVVEAAIRLTANAAKPETPCTEVPELSAFEKMRISRFDRTRAYIKIEDGCESHCTYCIIPAARGKIRSKAPEDVIAEAGALTAGGCREIVLTGIETASYGKDLKDCGLAELLALADAIPGIGRIRLGSLDPSLMKQAFVDRIASLRSLTPHFHLSVQSGSDTVLARMKRKYNSRMVFEGMERLRRAFPQVQFTTDIIVGFPGESDAEFEETLAFAEKAGFLRIHVFPYSRRAGTPAAVMPEQVPEEIKHRRAAILADAEAGIRKRILDGLTGQVFPVLFERTGEDGNRGHTPSFVEVGVDSSAPRAGETRMVRITGNDGERCRGELCPENDENTEGVNEER